MDRAAHYRWTEALGAAPAAAPPDLRSMAAEEALEALAVAAGLKPLAILGCGYVAPAFCAAVCAAAAAAGLAVVAGAPWIVNEGGAALPGWYAAAIAEGAATTPIWFIRRTGHDADIPPPGARINACEEARQLGYPLCCVRGFHRRRRSFHRLMAHLIRRQAAGDPAAMGRLARAQVMPTPRSDREVRWLALATHFSIAPFTSIALCRRCETDPMAPARRIGARYRALAMTVPVLAHLLGACALPSSADTA